MSDRNRGLNSPRVVNIEDLRCLAQRRLPQSVFDYLDGGADDEITLGENRQAFRDVTFRPRSAVAIGNCDTTTRVLGRELSFPAVLAPVGYSRLMHPGGDVAAAAAAGEAGIGYVLSTISGHKLENVKAASIGPVFYQLYLLGGRAAAENALDRAHRVGFAALVITVDTPLAGMRERDPRNGMKELLGTSIFAKIPHIPNILRHPRWLVPFLLDGGVPELQNIVVPQEGPMKLIDVAAALSQSVVTWDDLKWIRDVWSGPIVVKGILTGDDAKCAVDHGAAAVVVSNHGGRQLDGVSASLRALPEVLSAVNGQCEV
jgi:L-lactate dehydrogenase (cytochrome)